MDGSDDAVSSTSRPRFALIASGFAVVVLLALLAASFVVGDDDPGPAAGTDASSSAVPPRPGRPDVDGMLTVGLETPDGEPTTLDDLIDDRPVLVNQWSKTCTPCIEEMPWLDAIARANPQVEVIGVNVLDRPAAARAMAAQTGIGYRWVRDPAGDFSHAARTVNLPDTMLFSSDGTLLASKIGVFEDQAAIQAFLDDHGAGR